MFAAVFAIAAFLILGMVRHQVGHYAHKAMQGSLTSETATLVAEKPADLPDEIRQRVEATKGTSFQYLLIDRQGKAIVGGIPQDAAHEGWGSVMMREHPATMDNPEGPERLVTLGTRLADGSLLVVATDGYDVDKLGGHMVRFTILWAIAITLIALASGWMAGLIFLKRIGAANAAIERIVAGRTEQRLPMIGLAPELDNLARNINRMLDRIDGLMEGLRQVSTDVAHDLRTPLTRLRQMLEAAREATGREDTDAGIDVALAQADQLLATFRAILRLAQIEGGGRRAPFAPVDLDGLLATLIETYEPVAIDAQHTLAADMAADAMVNGDAELLAQLFANLIENAIIHTPTGTRVSLVAERAAGQIRVIVQDDGPGVAAAERERITRRFYQVDPSRSSGGSGLGLSIASAIVTLHGARLAIDDAGPGLRIEVSFSEWPGGASA
ncbi:HAMP domain-containing histidine kinase [Sphingomonas sp. CGMCC 1.13654]|uniref:histidine kinase n=1 Tax=Sphingomonas chungangi TaxID=2683589 RepID=A0A838L6I6_9SPHN|nr:HAMP domain-containing sensor histidine kinase [Sphingomonas chungangi]MBA2934315.1 HAMP domain-containing histidine kinase [Sphingomonas chungangi]